MVNVKSPAFDLAKIIANESEFGLEIQANLFVSLLPDNPTNCVAFLDSGGFANQTNYTYERSTVQMLVRDDNYEQAYKLALDLMRFLNGQHNVAINDSRYIMIRAMNTPLHIPDNNKKALVSVNFLIHRS